MALDICGVVAYHGFMNETPDAWAIQPRSFGLGSFDEWGCIWANSLEHAQRLAARFSELEAEAYVVWRVTLHGEMAWMTIG